MIPGVLNYCRSKFEEQVPFDYEFRLDDFAFYCVELTEKAFRSQGLVLSEPVRIGDWENLSSYPLTALAALSVTRADARPPDQLGAASLLARQRPPGDMGLVFARDRRRAGPEVRADGSLFAGDAAELVR